ncbi:hypothetical protein [Hyalangium versicolor]|uniref:hypothetical protein n=1 Tax=Hyalangium versicolor TaxID=2861190 RepID=UPI001CCDDF25|nr:hypothetical protein [Hyalangium versicolor]
MRLPLLLWVLVSAPVTHAQTDAPSPTETSAPPLVPAAPSPRPAHEAARAELPLVLEPGDTLILRLSEGPSYSGKLLGLVPEGLSLQLRTRQVVNVPLANVERLDLEKRWLLRGGLVGGGVGGLLGALGAGSVCLLSSTEGAVDVAGCTGTGFLVGGAIGAALGLVAGLANIHWDTVYERDKQGPLSLRLEEPGVIGRWFAQTGHRGEFGLLLGNAMALGRSRVTVGYGGRIHALLLLGPHFALGPELAVYNNVGDRTVVEGNGSSFHEDHSLEQLGGVMRGTVSLGPTRASLLVGLGHHGNITAHFGGSVGAEVEVRPWEQIPPLAFEARYLLQLADSGSASREQFLTLGLGTRVRW